MVFSFCSQPLCGLDLELPAFDLIGMMPVSLGAPILGRTQELHAAESAADGVHLLYEFTRDAFGYLNMLQAPRRAGVPEAHAYIAGDLREKLVA